MNKVICGLNGEMNRGVSKRRSWHSVKELR